MKRAQPTKKDVDNFEKERRKLADQMAEDPLNMVQMCLASVSQLDDNLDERTYWSVTSGYILLRHPGTSHEMAKLVSGIVKKAIWEDFAKEWKDAGDDLADKLRLVIGAFRTCEHAMKSEDLEKLGKILKDLS